MNTSKITYLGDLRTEAVHEFSGTKIITDAPLDNHGKAEAFSPTDLVATALGSCMLTLMGISARTHSIGIEGSTVEIEKIMTAAPRTIGKIIARVVIKNNNLTDKEKQILENTARTCPVARSLSEQISQEISFVYEA